MFVTKILNSIRRLYETFYQRTFLILSVKVYLRVLKMTKSTLREDSHIFCLIVVCSETFLTMSSSVECYLSTLFSFLSGD